MTPTFSVYLPAIVTGAGFLGAAVQDLRTKEVYDFWWAPIFLGSIFLFAQGDQVVLLARGGIFILVVALVFTEVGTKKWPMADGLGVLALYLASGAQAGFAFLLFGMLALMIWRVGRRTKFPWMPVIFAAWLLVFLGALWV